ncbi:MAG TPA: response regulator transcription factor [Atribacteraceae bacterium]|nr:response regulator transcription factor [Atribacteraceae bacterium]
MRIYLVEDDRNLNRILSSYLQREGWEVLSFFTGEDAKAAVSQPPHLWVLDIMLPEIDGFALIKLIKARSPEVPVIFISARDADLDRIAGLEMGSDDYLAKPFLPRELTIRIRKLLERVYNRKEKELPPVELSPYLIHLTARMVTSGGKPINLTAREFDLLLFFSKNSGQALSREQILEAVWGPDYFGSDRAVDDLVRRLRKKMPELRLDTLYAFGYRLNPQ